MTFLQLYVLHSRFANWCVRLPSFKCSLIIGTGCWVQVFSLILDSSVALWVGVQSAGELVCETSQLRILHSSEEDNLSPFDCLCQSIEINNKHVYRQSQVQKPIGIEVKWAECSLITGMGCWIQVFSLILDSSVALWVGIQSAGKLVCMWLPSFESCIQQGKTTCLLSIPKSLACAIA